MEIQPLANSLSGSLKIRFAMNFTHGLSVLSRVRPIVIQPIQPLNPALSIHKHQHINNYSSNCRMKKALVFLAPGHEEIEFVTAVDVLRRGGVDVVIASLEGKDPVKGRSNICTLPDVSIKDICGSFDAMILPGGLGGTKALCGCARVGELLKEQEKACKIIAAICAAPVALKAHGIGKGKCLTSYPSTEKEMTDTGDYKYKCDDVVVDEYLITSRGPATSIKFSLTILMHLTDENKACEVAKALLVK